ncbi:MAG: extracellular solute-binding protein, partial [Propionicimonas sp.]|nr:extracellular solute-binding protein [Propionicimonas sp.]
EAGIASPPSTMDEFIADTKKLTKADGSQYGFALPDNGFTLGWSILQWANGGDILDDKGCSVLDSDANKATFQTWGELVSKDKVSPVGLDAPAGENLFSTSKAAMIVGGPWLVETFKKAGVDYGVTTMPVGSAGPVTAISTVPFMISKATKHPEEAAEFLTWWTGETAQAQFSKEAGFPPVRTDMSADASNEMLKPFTDGLADGKLVMPAQSKAAQITSDVYEPLLGKVMRGEDVATLVADATMQINTITGCK